MKVSVVTSSALHVSVVAFGLISLAAPEPFEAKEVESVQIELVPVSALAEAVQGAEKAPLINIPNPDETKADPVADNAENVGEAKDDTKSVEAKEEAPVAVKETAPPKVEPTPTPAPRISEKPDPAPKPQPAPATEVASVAQKEIQPQAVAEETPTEAIPSVTETAVAELPKSVPVPSARPSPPKAQKATTPDRKVPETETANATSAPAKTSKSEADEVAALINREKSKKGGAKRVSGQKSLGTKKKSKGKKLSRGEREALRNHFENCFQIQMLENFAGVDEVTVSVLVNFNEQGQIVGKPKATASGGDRTAQRHAMRSIVRDIRGCKNPPLPDQDKFSTWAQVKLNYSMSEILNAGY